MGKRKYWGKEEVERKESQRLKERWTEGEERERERMREKETEKEIGREKERSGEREEERSDVHLASGFHVHLNKRQRVPSKGDIAVR